MIIIVQNNLKKWEKSRNYESKSKKRQPTQRGLQWLSYLYVKIYSNISGKDSQSYSGLGKYIYMNNTFTLKYMWEFYRFINV